MSPPLSQTFGFLVLFSLSLGLVQVHELSSLTEPPHGLINLLYGILGVSSWKHIQGWDLPCSTHCIVPQRDSSFGLRSPRPVDLGGFLCLNGIEVSAFVTIPPLHSMLHLFCNIFRFFRSQWVCCLHALPCHHRVNELLDNASFQKVVDDTV